MTEQLTIYQKRIRDVQAEKEALRVALADCKQLAKGEQSLLDSLRAVYADSEVLAQELTALKAERDLLEQERDTALYDLEREQRAHELHHGGPR